MIKCSFSQLAHILEIEKTSQPESFCGVKIDSRQVTPQNLFVAIVGEKLNGHRFVGEAEKSGAAAAIVSETVKTALPCFQVSDTTLALGKLASFWRQQFILPMVAVTGSNGKTTVKNMIGSILQQVDHCLVTEGNLNNHLGVPLNLCRLNSQHRYAVLELAMNHFGEIAYLSKMVQPKVAVITNVYPSHLEGVGDLKGVAKAKGEIFQGLTNKGTAILNAESDYIDYWKTLLDDQAVITFGCDHAADVMALQCQAALDNVQFILQAAKDKCEIHLPVPGHHNIMNALAAAAACLVLKINLSDIKNGLEKFTPIHSRLTIKKMKNGAWLLDDTYNANPASLKAAVETLIIYPGKKILVLGDMKELGPNANQLHHLSGQHASAAGVDYLLAVGEFASDVVQGFGESAWAFSSKEALLKKLQTLLTPKVTVLVKGSRAMQMEEVVSQLI